MAKAPSWRLLLCVLTMLSVFVSARAFGDDEDEPRPIDLVQEDTNNGPPSATTDKIVGGKEALPGTYPFQVALIKATVKPGREYYGQFCGGVLIDKQWVLTAAHCVVRTAAKEMQVYVGSTVLPAGEATSGSGGARISVKAVTRHHLYSRLTRDNDIALLQLQQPAESKYTPAVFATPELESRFGKIASPVVVIGWGATVDQGKGSPVLMEVDLKIDDPKSCARGLKTLVPTANVTTNMFCAGMPGKKADACQGDSGGFIGAPIAAKKYVVLGVVSWGIGCARPGLDGVYTRVANYVDWAKTVMQF